MSQYGEPWEKGEQHESMCHVLREDGTEVCYIEGSSIILPLATDVFDRIVACVNFCQSVPTEMLLAILDQPHARQDIMERCEQWVKLNPHLFSEQPQPPSASASQPPSPSDTSPASAGET